MRYFTRLSQNCNDDEFEIEVDYTDLTEEDFIYNEYEEEDNEQD
jgi:hypothetical protein